MTLEHIQHDDSARLVALERVIARGQQTFIDVGNALLEIREQRLYRAQYASFDDYCRERWGWSRVHAHRQIEAARIANMLPRGNTEKSETEKLIDVAPVHTQMSADSASWPTTERHARELVPLLRTQPDAIPAAWEAAHERARLEQAPLAARHVRDAVAEQLDASPTSEQILDVTLRVVPGARDKLELVQMRRRSSSAALAVRERLLTLDPSVLADVEDDGGREMLRRLCDDLDDWIVRYRVALQRGLHVVEIGD